MNKWLGILCVLAVAGVVASVAYPAPLMGEAPQGVQKALNQLGIPVSWSNPNTVLYTCNNPNGFVVLHVVPRNPTGTQPLSYSLSVQPGGSPTSFTTALALVNNVFQVLSSQIVTGTMGQSVVITPLNTTTGGILVDVVGYEGL